MKSTVFTIWLLFSFLIIIFSSYAQQDTETSLPVRGFAIAAPKAKDLDRFARFIEEELAPRKVNTLILRIDYNYQYTSHPELADQGALSATSVKKIVTVCQKHGIRLIPQINLLGHQSWASTTHNLLRVYPEFDETPHVKMPEKYVWPNEDGLYCKSYCPLHPDVHKIVFALVDEICEVFEADAFHAGMDEVFYIGDDRCSRCAGLDRAALFAGEVTKIRNHLATKNRELWIWGDRLIDGETTGIGMWEASLNDTHRAIHLIPRDVVIGDWHYERPDKTAVYFATKGFRVITCTWKRPEVATAQVEDMIRFRRHSTEEMKRNFYGVMQTVWSGTDIFLDGFYNNTPDAEGGKATPWHTFTTMYDELSNFDK